MEWEEEDDFSFDSDEDHNPVIRKKRRESDPPEDRTEGRQSNNEGALISSPTTNSETEVSKAIVRGKYSSILTRSSTVPSVTSGNLDGKLDPIKISSQIFELLSALSEEDISVTRTLDGVRTDQAINKDADHNPRKKRRESDSPEEVSEGRQSNNEGALISSPTTNSESEVGDVILLERDGENPLILKPNSFEREDNVTDPPEPTEKDSSLSTLEQKDCKNLNIILFGGNANFFFDGENEVQVPLNSLGKVLELNLNLQSLSVCACSPPQNLKLPISLPILPHLTILRLDSLVGVDYAPFQPYFPQLLELQLSEFNCWKDEYNNGHFSNLRTLILGGIEISGNINHWSKLLKIFNTLKAASLSILELRFQRNRRQNLDLQIGEFNCWENEYNQAGLFPNLRTLILGGMDCFNATHWRKLLQLFETLNAPSLNILELRFQRNRWKNLDRQKCLEYGFCALDKRSGNERGGWEATLKEIVSGLHIHYKKVITLEGESNP